MLEPKKRHQSRDETLSYMQTILGQLTVMAQGERYDMLAYLIEMAYVEASDMIEAGQKAKRENGKGKAA